MHVGFLALILAVGPAPLAGRQTQGLPAQTGSAASKALEAPEASRATPQPVALSAQQKDSLREIVAKFREDAEAVKLPPEADIAMGGLTVAAGTDRKSVV